MKKVEENQSPKDRRPWQTADKCWSKLSEGDEENRKQSPARPRKNGSICLLRFVKGALRRLSADMYGSGSKENRNQDTGIKVSPEICRW